ncbi:hemin import ATP-binding protein HmuV [Roseibium aquae]|uniref:Hemin import ATP-binding protein HmuV n=1 Tax=Roseibium aquae TaxID=1323746 RepID=A0A916TNL9_9HYPH|nr:heme ABC transporter ATP-binding protein [Roseibium aquae]GGB60279.1 hemin import ATP-binding protein HmuV [Roseibium aquae]
MTKQLTFENLTVRLGGREIVHQISAAFAAGQVTAVVGANGAGKSTFLKAVTGELAFSGAAHLGTIDLAQADPATLAFLRGVLPQQTSLAFPLTVDEVVRLGQVVPEGSRWAQEARRRTALGRVGLAGFETRGYHDLSGGEQQRVQLARVLVQVWNPVDTAAGQPRWLFLDEPVSSLDVRHQIQIMEIARAYANAGGGVVAIMHDLNLTAHYADKIMVLKHGRMTAFGDMADVFQTTVLSEAYDHPVRVNAVPQDGIPFVLPIAQTLSAHSAPNGR